MFIIEFIDIITSFSCIPALSAGLSLEILDTNQSISHIKEPPTNKVRKILEKWIGKENIGLIPVPKVIEVFHHLNREPDWNNLKEEILLKAPGAWVVLVDNSKEDNKWKNYIFFLMAIIIYLLFIGIIIRKLFISSLKYNYRSRIYTILIKETSRSKIYHINF